MMNEQKSAIQNFQTNSHPAYAGHYEKSLWSDNDLGCYSREMKIISSDWIALLRRLLIQNKYSATIKFFRLSSKKKKNIDATLIFFFVLG